MQAELIEYRVVTACGRIFAWSEHDYDSLIRDLHFRGYKPVYIKPMSEYEAEIMAREEQERLTDELFRAVEEELKHSA